LSFSEHIKFNTAYISATILTLLLVTGYTKAILKSNKISLLIFGILLILYTFIFTIIQLEDYALLIGSVGMFVVLAIVMYFSRKIDWYNIKINESKE
jgi:inner membrane protein